MLKLIGLFAGIEVKEESGIFVELTRGGKERLIILGVVLFVTVLIFLWALAFRKPRRRHSRRHSQTPVSLKRYRREQHEDEGLLALLRPKHRRHKHRFHHRNPTLAETGGLPPARSEDAPPTPP
jgi:hypothetical protein